MAANAVELRKACVVADRFDAVEQFALLLDRKKNIRRDADDERPVNFQFSEPRLQ